MSNATHTIDPRENADTANEPAAAPSGTEPAEEESTRPAPNGYPVTSTIFRRDGGEAYYALDTAVGGTWIYTSTVAPSRHATIWRGTIRADFAPRTDTEARNQQGREVVSPLVMEAIFYGDFRNAHAIMRAAVAAVALRREAAAAHSRRRKAAKAAQDAPAPVYAANTSPDADERF